MLSCAGCGSVFSPQVGPIFSVPLSIEGQEIGPAIIDSGGGYEVILRESFGLEITGTANLIAFGGVESVQVTEGFTYQAGMWAATAQRAFVGLSVCDCNGLGIDFFRKTGAVIALDFSARQAAFPIAVPVGGATIPFLPPPPHLPGFDSSFIDVDVQIGEVVHRVRALLDTGSNVTLLHRLSGSLDPTATSATIGVTHPVLGGLSIEATLFDTEGLPDLILGTNAMRDWADRWYFKFLPEGGTLSVFSLSSGAASSASALLIHTE